MKPCSHRQLIGSPTHVGCTNHADLLHNGTVPKCVCEKCPYSLVPAEGFNAQTEQLYILKQRRGEYKPVAKGCDGCGEAKTTDASKIAPVSYKGVLDWAVTITTAPRRVNYLPQCVDSLRSAGWSNPVVFAEPGSTTLSHTHTIFNEVRLGCFHNWLSSAKWALENTTAEQILMMQDDVVVHPGSRELAEKRLLWPDDAAFVSLYTPQHYAKGRTGFLKIATKSMWGACALIWKREALQEAVLSSTICGFKGLGPKKKKSETIAEHRERVKTFKEARKEKPELINNSDYAIGLAVLRMSKRMYYVSPSPARHIATVSSIRHGDNKGKRNCDPCSDPAKSLEDQVFGPTEEQR